MRAFLARGAAAAAAAASASALAACAGVPASGRKVSASDALMSPATLPKGAEEPGRAAAAVADVAGMCACGSASRRAFDETAEEYDDLVGREELFMGLRLLRWWLLRGASGDVLEVACGTARNLPHYGQGVASLTMMDASDGMLGEARRKARELVQRGGRLKQVTLVRGSAEALPLETGAYDCVVDTFGLCSMDDPVGALLEMQRVCRPGGKVRRRRQRGADGGGSGTDGGGSGTAAAGSDVLCWVSGHQSADPPAPAAGSGSRAPVTALTSSPGRARCRPHRLAPAPSPRRSFCSSTASAPGASSMTSSTALPESTSTSGGAGTTATSNPS